MKTLLLSILTVLSAAAYSHSMNIISAELADKECQYIDDVIAYLDNEEILPKIDSRTMFSLCSSSPSFSNLDDMLTNCKCRNLKRVLHKRSKLYMLLSKRRNDMDDNSLVECTECIYGLRQLNCAFKPLCRRCVLGWVKPVEGFRITINPIDAWFLTANNEIR